MNTSTPTQPPRRPDRLLREQIHDTYRPRGRLKEPTRCPECGAVYHKGRWSWTAESGGDVAEELCSACRRIADAYPAGEVMVEGAFVPSHKNEILNLVRNVEAVESKEHPMNRIMAINAVDGGLHITTTDVHLPRRIGKALRDAWEGTLDVHFDDEGCFTRIVWNRD